jgi:hypothetical protein
VTSRPEVEQLSQRRLNRALLARQLLLDRADLPVTKVIEAVGGLQTQYAPSGYVALWTRLRSFERDSLTRALENRDVIQGTLMRGTIHTVTAADYWPLVCGIRTSRMEWFEGVTKKTRGDLDMRRVADMVRGWLGDGPLRMPEIIARLTALGYPRETGPWSNVWLDLVRVPPSGTWEKRRADLYGLAEQWLPRDREYTEDEGLELLLRRYLGGFGPAPLTDFKNWAGVTVTRVKDVVARMDLHRFRDENGKELLDLPGAPLPDEETPAPVRFIPVFEPMLLANTRRAGIVPPQYRLKLMNIHLPHPPGAVLVDGSVRGTWRFDGDRVVTEVFEKIGKTAERELATETDRLTEFHRA